MAEEVSEVRGMDDGGGLSLWGSLRSKLAPLLGMLACARRLITARRKGRGDERALCCRRCQRSVPLGKTLRGPRGGLILTNDEELIKRINSAIFPYYQGGPLEHIIAAKAICFKEALSPEFKQYVKQLIRNNKACRDEFAKLGDLVSDTDNHLFLLNVLDSFGMTGLDAQKKLELINITTNKNMIPGDTLKPNKTSGLRIGFAAVTTRGCTEEDARHIARLIHNFLKGSLDEKAAKKEVKEMVSYWKLIERI